MVPNGWNQLKGKEITSKITKGSSPKWQGFDYQKEGTLFVTSENVRDGFLDISSPKYLPLEFNQKLKNSQLEKGDILINIVGASIGRSCQFDIENQSANINQAVCLFRTNELVKSEFIYQFLQHSTTVNKLLGTQSESARPNLSLSDMRDFVFSIPPLPEQRKIAKILSTWDKAISTTERLIDNSKQQKKALMQQLLTGKKRLLDDSGKSFESEWEEKRLSEIGDIYSGGTPSTAKPEYWDGDINWVTPTDITKQDSIYIESTARLVSTDGIKNSSAKLLPKGTLLVCTRATIGEMAIASHEMSTNQGFKNIVPNEKTNIEFVYYLLNFYKHKLISKASGSTFLELSKSAFEGMHFHIPDYQEQKKIAAVLLNADREIDVLQQQLSDLKQEKKALMQQLLTGKRRVKVDKKEVA